MRTYEELEAVVKGKGYRWFENKMSLNFIWERTSRLFTDKFDDFFYVAFINLSGAKTVIWTPATTKAGLYSAQNPTTVDGITGVAIIKPGQYLSSWELFTGDKLAKFLQANKIEKYPWVATHFRQIKPIDYYRDGDKDAVLEQQVEIDGKIFYTQWHNMSRPGTYGSGLVQNWSAGCMGWPEPETHKFLPTVYDSVRLFGDIVSGTLLESEDFK